jgi:hypothetical protein
MIRLSDISMSLAGALPRQIPLEVAGNFSGHNTSVSLAPVGTPKELENQC